MRRFLTTWLTGALVLALAAPATVSASTPDDSGKAGGATPTVATATRPADTAARTPSILRSVDRAVAATMAAAPAVQAPTPVTRKSKTSVRAQGGGGSTGMIIGLVSTLVGVAATVYMVKEMKKTTEAAQTPARAR